MLIRFRYGDEHDLIQKQYEHTTISIQLGIRFRVQCLIRSRCETVRQHPISRYYDLRLFRVQGSGAGGLGFWGLGVFGLLGFRGFGA